MYFLNHSASASLGSHNKSQLNLVQRNIIQRLCVTMEKQEINELFGNPRKSEADDQQLDYFPFIELPKEIRGLIYNRIPQAHKLKCRLVCSQLRTEIDELCTFDGIINEFKPYWERIFGLRLRMCTIRNLVADASPFVFKYPHAVKALSIDLDQRELPLYQVSAANVGHVLTQIAKHLTWLHLNNRSFTAEFAYPLKVANFANLRALTVELNFERITWESFDLFVSNTTISYLAFLHLDLTIYELNSAYQTMFSKVMCSTLKLLARNRRLVQLELFAHGGKPDEGEAIEIEIEDSDLVTVDLTLLSKLVQLKSYRVVLFEIEGENNYVRVGDNFIQGWLHLLQQQRGLVKYDIAGPSPWSICKSIISANFASLAKVRLDPLLFQRNDAQPVEMLLDLTVFQRCSRLTHLYLGLNISTTQVHVQHLQVRLDNLCHLPISLEFMGLRNFSILADDLLQFISSPSVHKNFRTFFAWGAAHKYDELYQRCKSQLSGFEANDDEEYRHGNDMIIELSA